MPGKDVANFSTAAGLRSRVVAVAPKNLGKPRNGKLNSDFLEGF